MITATYNYSVCAGIGRDRKVLQTDSECKYLFFDMEAITVKNVEQIYETLFQHYRNIFDDRSNLGIGIIITKLVAND